jgi:ABC-type phosphate transport system substrate-binding protein
MLRPQVPDPVKPGASVHFCGIGLLVTLATACGGGGEMAAAPAVAPPLIQPDGSNTVFPISEAVAEEFQKTLPQSIKAAAIRPRDRYQKRGIS